MNTETSWGIPANRSHSAGLACTEPGCKFGGPSAMVEQCRHAVGFDKDKARDSDWGGTRLIGALVIQCPHCFTYYWFHITEDLVREMEENLGHPIELAT